MSKNLIDQFKDFAKELQQKVTLAIEPLPDTIAREIETGVKKHFFYPRDSREDLIKTRKAFLGIFKVQYTLTYVYKSIPLSHYPIRQIRVTTGNRKLYVSRTSGKDFKKRIVSQQFEIKTLVRIRKNSGFKLVNGKRGFGFKGWLHTGRKGSYDRMRVTHDTGSVYAGTINKFSAKILERNQRPTWRGGVRLPVHQLFGPSLTQLLQTAEMKQFMNSPVLLEKLGDKVMISFGRLL